MLQASLGIWVLRSRMPSSALIPFLGVKAKKGTLFTPRLLGNLEVQGVQGQGCG